MKEFELKYKSALGTATTMYACAKESNDKEIIQSLELIFPELKESEDEKIRKYLIDVVNDYCKGSEHDGCIAWLEKQGEQITNSKTDWSEKDETTLACLIGTLTWVTNNNYHCSEDIPKYMCWLENLKQRLNR